MSQTVADVQMWLVEPLPQDVAASIEHVRTAPAVRRVAVMPDVHLSGDVCIGLVIATDGLIYPSAVGSDIGCGMATVRFHGEANCVEDARLAGRILAGLYRAVPSIKHHRADELPESLRSVGLSHPRLETLTRRDGRVQLGTLGRGNHFLELQSDAEGHLWAMVHSGSRGMGQAITTHHVKESVHRVHHGLGAIECDSPQGRAYLQDVAWARAFAGENRLTMLRAVECLLAEHGGFAADWQTLIHSDHNHVQLESHFGQVYWVHRKGAQLAADGIAGIVPGSMATPSFHVVGRACEAALRSCAHGAGRRLSRKLARRAIRRRDFERQMANVWFDHRRIDALRDEAPGAYKDIHDVMRAQRELVRRTCEVQPRLCYKGS